MVDPRAVAEPRVVAADVSAAVLRYMDRGYSIAMVAEDSGVGVDRLRRILRGRWHDISLDEADRLMLAVDANVNECDLVE